MWFGLGFPKKIIFAIIVVVVLVIIYSMYNLHGKDYEEFMYGYWQGDEGFCDECEVESMQLFIGEPTEQSFFKKLGGKKERLAYLIINDNITNQQIKLSYKPAGAFSLGLPKYEFFAEIEYQEECEIPAEATFEFDMKKGRLRIHDGKKIYAVMYKNHEISELTRS